jgi:hypothetical protein
VHQSGRHSSDSETAFDNVAKVFDSLKLILLWLLERNTLLNVISLSFFGCISAVQPRAIFSKEEGGVLGDRPPGWRQVTQEIRSMLRVRVRWRLVR